VLVPNKFFGGILIFPLFSFLLHGFIGIKPSFSSADGRKKYAGVFVPNKFFYILIFPIFSFPPHSFIGIKPFFSAADCRKKYAGVLVPKKF
jgi:hypothetical protein